jgi:tRNA(fMet)-specific endonuclease VapC
MVDTGVFIALEKARHPDAAASFDAYGQTYVSAVTVSELLAGIRLADTDARRARRTAFVEGMLAQVRVLSFGEEVARVHASLHASLRLAGRQIGAHALIIAATALYHDLPLLTGNAREFARVDGLDILDLGGT